MSTMASKTILKIVKRYHRTYIAVAGFGVLFNVFGKKSFFVSNIIPSFFSKNGIKCSKINGTVPMHIWWTETRHSSISLDVNSENSIIFFSKSKRLKYMTHQQTTVYSMHNECQRSYMRCDYLKYNSP